MKPLIFLLLFLTSSLSIADTIEDASKINALKQGETTSAEVEKVFGKPVHEDHNPDGRFVYVYEVRLPFKDEPAKPPLVGSIAFIFSADKRLIRYNLYKDDNATGK